MNLINLLNVESIFGVIIIGVFFVLVIRFTSQIMKNKSLKKQVGMDNIMKTNDNNELIQGRDGFNIIGDNNNVQISDMQVSQNANILQANDDYLATNILFIDDDSDYKITDILLKMGFRNVNKLNDISSIDLPEIKRAAVLFIDVNGVGTEIFGNKEGLGAALSIKKRYPDKKVVLYSGYPHMFDSDLQQLDGVLAKNSAPEQFRAMIESFCVKLN